MTDFLLKLFGITTADARNISDMRLKFHGVNPAWVFLAAVVLAGLVVLMYRKAAPDLSPARKYGLAVLRAIFLVLILVLLIRPVISVTFEQTVRRTLLLLVDSSESMGKIPDQRSHPDDVARAGIAKGTLDPLKALKDQPTPGGSTQAPRIELVQAALKNPKLDLLPRLAKDYDLEVYTFDRDIRQVTSATYTLPQSEIKDDRGFFAAYPWFVPLILCIAGVGVTLVGFLTRAPLARNIGLGVLGLGMLGFVLASLWASDPQSRRASATTRPVDPDLRASINTAWVDSLAAEGDVSAVGDSVRNLISRKRGKFLAGVVLVTDGAYNAGAQPIGAATLAGQDRVPLYVYGVGITSPKDVIVGQDLFAQDVAFMKDEVPVSVRVRSMGMTGQTAKLTVKMGPETAERDVAFNADGEQVVTLTLTPKTPGEHQILASIEPRDDEVVKNNNAAGKSIKVIDGKIKILFVEQYPRWEFKYAQAILMRDRRVDLKCVLYEGDAEITHGKDSPYLAEFPQKKEDLFKYDLVIIGDVDPKHVGPREAEMLHEFVSKFGGAVAMVAGRRYNPNAYRRTPLEKMLPVELESETTIAPQSTKPIRLELTPSGKASPMLRLAPKELDSAARWAQLPPIYWANKVARAKPAADVLLVDPDPAKASRYGKMPVMAIQQYGLGSVLYVGTDNLWRWRKNVGDKYHSMLWGQTTQRMALPHLLGATKRTHLTSDQKAYTTGQPVTIYARLYTEAFEPMTEPSVRGSYVETGDRGTPRDVILKALPEQPGMYRGVLTAPGAGQYAFHVAHDPATVHKFEVTEPQREMLEPAMNKTLLEQMAAASNGQFFREEDLVTLPERVSAKVEKKKTTQEAEIGYSWFYLVLLLSVVTTEWIIRKVSQLK